jgi:hypothetical protein
MSARININQIIGRVREGVSDMAYAQHRVFENRTGVATGHDRRRGSSAPRGGPPIATDTSELEALYAQDVKTGWR